MYNINRFIKYKSILLHYSTTLLKLLNVCNVRAIFSFSFESVEHAFSCGDCYECYLKLLVRDILCHPNFTIHDIAPHWHWVIQFIQFTILMFHKKFPQNINSYKAIYFNESCADKTVANAGAVEVGCGRGAMILVNPWLLNLTICNFLWLRCWVRWPPCHPVMTDINSENLD